MHTRGPPYRHQCTLGQIDVSSVTLDDAMCSKSIASSAQSRFRNSSSETSQHSTIPAYMECSRHRHAVKPQYDRHGHARRPIARHACPTCCPKGSRRLESTLADRQRGLGPPYRLCPSFLRTEPSDDAAERRARKDIPSASRSSVVTMSIPFGCQVRTSLHCHVLLLSGIHVYRSLDTSLCPPLPTHCSA